MIESILLGVGHRARHGKDTAAAEIIKQRVSQYDVRHYAFAQVLKQEVNEEAIKAGGMQNLWDHLFYFSSHWSPLPGWVQYDPNPDMTDPYCPLGKQRTLLQFWGTEYRRDADPDYWVKKLGVRIEREKPEIALITDMRFLNEAAWIKQYGEVIKVDRPGFNSGCTPHVSEEALANYDGWDYVIENTGTLEELQHKAVIVFDELMNKRQ